MSRRAVTARFLAALVGFSSLFGPMARAATQTELVPVLSFAAGVDDNVLFDGAGGDQVGKGALRLRGQAFDRTWKAALELGAGALGFQERQRLVLTGESIGTFDLTPSPGQHFEALVRVRAADDPLALAQVGLLAASGRALGLRARSLWEQRVDRRWGFAVGAGFDGVRFLPTPGVTLPTTVQDGGAASALVSLRHRLTPRLVLDPTLEGRLFLTDAGLAAESMSLLAGAMWIVARRTNLSLALGPTAYRDDLGTLFMASARLQLDTSGRRYQVGVSASHDLTVPASRAGVLAGELAEAVGRWGTRSVELRARAGLYRSRPSPRDERWFPGYGLEAGAFLRVLPVAWLGVSALRFERLATATEPALARDAVYLRLDLTTGRP